MDFTIQTLDHLKPLIKGFRKRANLTQAAMAEKLGISQQSYAQIESNLASTSVERLFTILRLLHVRIQLADENCDPVRGDQSVFAPKEPRAPRQTVGTAKLPGGEAGVHHQRAPRTSHVDRAARGALVQPGKARQTVTPAKVIKRNDTTKW